tara:strand:- start:307 stop:546 length:240 start_codon:yes stop_codon:yes gene_type:complete
MDKIIKYNIDNAIKEINVNFKIPITKLKKTAKKIDIPELTIENYESNLPVYKDAYGNKYLLLSKINCCSNDLFNAILIK